MIYEVHYEYQTDQDDSRNRARSMTIHFRARGERAAALGAIAFWRNRHACVPSHFRRCGCVQVYLFEPPELKGDGFLGQARTKFAFEWKVTTGCGPGATIGARLLKNPAGDPFNV